MSEGLIGDPTPLGWATTLAYFVAAAVAAWAAWRAVAGARAFLWATSLGLLALGVNKQLDAQTWIFRAGRDATIEAGLYETHRADVHLAAAVIAGVIGVTMVVAIVVMVRRVIGRAVVLLAGALLVMTYVVIRQAIFHGIEPLASHDGDASIAAIELVGIGLIAIGAVRMARA